ncbi:hypothetical protein PHOBOS_75 [Erwinia phage vB_EamM_Phobos]|uniref:hypothetical protein n=1 Tax=Erwinia phage vB_EamM_Phobos TaxID=1883377 RepID=UPI00081C6343|nr:hypothetical protein BIZ79_gp075 [Erwinia phage vB_EamM_Phobos]ANZ50265.1 hypothetical protein PHOBOS_75 [Erwinia phage vB_EamM_Phobos]
MNFQQQRPSAEPSILPTYQPFTRTVVYENRTNVPVTVSQAHGEYIVIHPLTERVPAMEFNVYVHYQARTESSLAGLKGALTDKEYGLVREGIVERGYATLKFRVTDFSAFVLDEGIHLPNIGIAIAKGVHAKHLFPSDKPAPTEKENISHLQISVSVITDNPLKAERKYIRFLSSIIEVQPQVSSVYEPGVYIVINSNGPNPFMEFFNLEDKSCPFRVFPTRAQAEAFEWADSSPEYLNMLKEQLARDRLIIDKEANEKRNELEFTHKRQLDELTLRKEEMGLERKEREAEFKMRLEQQKAYYEERSYARKDSSELLKWLPAMITGAAALFGFLA